MEGWRQRRIGSDEDHSTIKGNYKNGLTLTGLLMEGLGHVYNDFRIQNQQLFMVSQLATVMHCGVATRTVIRVTSFVGENALQKAVGT
jgi:hypothetical protein